MRGVCEYEVQTRGEGHNCGGQHHAKRTMSSRGACVAAGAVGVADAALEAPRGSGVAGSVGFC